VKTQKIYLETTMFNYYFEPDRDAYKSTIALFKAIKDGKYQAYTSFYVLKELNDAEEDRRNKMLGLIKEYNVEVFDENKEAVNLARVYIENGIIPKGSLYDALHIAVATINEIDLILSLNFQHINRVKTKTGTLAINKLYGYNKEIMICSPQEVM